MTLSTAFSLSFSRAAAAEGTGAPGVAERVLTSTTTSTAHSSSEKEMTSISGNEGGGEHVECTAADADRWKSNPRCTNDID